jgi:hypothetical protein
LCAREARCHDGGLPRTVLFLAPDAIPAGAALRIIVPDSDTAEARAVAGLGTPASGGERLELDHGPDGPDAEGALIDAWRALGRETTARVWCAAGPLAGVLLRIGVGAVHPVAVFGRAHDAERAPNARSRSLLASVVPDAWSLALSHEPPVDAARWRARLRAAIELGWTIHWDDGPPADPKADGWLDAELASTWRSPAGVTAWPATAAAIAPPPRPEIAAKVLAGRRGRHFLVRDTHDSHRQFVGQRPLSAAELDAWEQGTRARQARMAARGARLIQLIGPAPQAVHAADLPEPATLSADRPALQLLRRLRTLSPPPELLYPLDQLQRTSAWRDTFSKTDSHWNELGAYLAYEAVLQAIGDTVPVRRVTRSDVSFYETCFTGDLGEKVLPARASVFLRARVHEVRARLVRDNRVRNHGREAEFACDAAPPGVCIVFGDSWAYAMIPFLAESFRRLVFRHRVNVVDDDLVERERPDLVLTILTERFCTALPLDEKAIPFEREVARKHKANALVPPPEPGEPSSLQFSLDLHRQSPAHGGFQLPE